MAYKLNGCDTGGIPMYLIKPLLDKYDIRYLVETGSAGGNSARVAANYFHKVWTIELIEERAETEDAPSNIEFLTGDSAELLTEIMSDIRHLYKGVDKKYTLFYLDAHYSGNTPNESGYPECPVMKEIELIAEYGEDALIIIDDARLFYGQPPYPHNASEWPNICDIFILLRDKFPYHKITITDDFILCMSHHVQDVLDKEWRDRFHIRYPNENDKLKEQVKDVYKALLKYME